MRAYFVSGLLLATIASCTFEQREVSSPTVVRFGSRDSVLLLATGPIHNARGDTGLGYEYHPFLPLDDTMPLRTQAMQLWRIVRLKAESLRVRAVLLTATTKLTVNVNNNGPGTAPNFPVPLFAGSK